MKMKIVTTQIIELKDSGEALVVSTESKIEPLETPIITDQFTLTESHKTYNYITLGKNSHVKLERGSLITVKHGNNIVRAKTHRTQLNRIDGMRIPLNGFSVGDVVNVIWDSASSTLELA